MTNSAAPRTVSATVDGTELVLVQNQYLDADSEPAVGPGVSSVTVTAVAAGIQ